MHKHISIYYNLIYKYIYIYSRIYEPQTGASCLYNIAIYKITGNAITVLSSSITINRALLASKQVIVLLWQGFYHVR